MDNVKTTNAKYNFALSNIDDILKEKEDEVHDILSEIDNLEFKLDNYNVSQDGNEEGEFFKPVTNEREKYFASLLASKKDIGQEIEVLENKLSQKHELISKLKIIEKCLMDQESSRHDKHVEDMKNNEINRQILKIQEIERGRIASDLHDSTIQSLTNLIHRTELCTKLLDMDIIRTRIELLGMISSIRTIINDMREFIFELKPMSLKDLGFGITVKRFLDKIMKTKGIRYVLRIIPEERELPDIVQITLFRIIQEACNNIVKHSQADEINVLIEYGDNDINVEIKDNGIGFDIESVEVDDGDQGYKLGLSIMKERVLLLSGELKFVKNDKKGTIVKIRVPYFDNRGEDEENGFS